MARQKTYQKFPKVTNVRRNASIIRKSLIINRMKNYKENLSYFSPGWAHIQKRGWAVGGILNKQSCTGTDQVLLPSFPGTGSWGGHHILAMQRAENMAQGIIQMTVHSLRVISFAEIEEAFFRYHVSLWSLWHISICGPKLNVWNTYVVTTQEQAARHKDTMKTNRDLEEAGWEELWGAGKNELSWAEESSGGLSSGIRESKYNLHRRTTWYDCWFPKLPYVLTQTFLVSRVNQLVGFD